VTAGVVVEAAQFVEGCIEIYGRGPEAGRTPPVLEAAGVSTSFVHSETVFTSTQFPEVRKSG